MDYLAREQKLSGMTYAQLQDLGLKEPGFKEWSMVVIAKWVTNMTKKPGGLPKWFGSGCAFFLGHYDIDDWRVVSKQKNKRKQRVRAKLDNGRTVNLQYITCPERYRKEDGKDRIILFSHGFNSVSTFMLQYYSVYMKEGYTAVLFEQRGHGKSRKYPCTMGYDEASDLVSIVKYLRKKHGKEALIGVQGESMGSGTLAQALDGIDETSDFAVLDCGYAGMDEMARWIEKLFPFYDQTVLHDLVDELSRAGSARYSDVNGLQHVAAVRPNYPVFFAHGGVDTFVPTRFSKEMAKAKRGKSELHIYKWAFHAMSRFLYGARYEQDVRDWMKKNYLV